MAASNVSGEVRVRFPPSPTGYLHVGGARTALFNWLFARANGGKFLLRIEDTDRERSKDEFVQDIEASLKWLGLNWDEPPVFQSKRIERHLEFVHLLLEKGLAYRCDKSPEALEALRKSAQDNKQTFRYADYRQERTAAEVDGKPHVIRMRCPEDGETSFHDLIRGPITIPNKMLDDWVVLRSDGSPTYNFVAVVDDHDQAVTHILRGEDHINNTPKQALLYDALGFQKPAFAHLPMILGKDKTKLSKRHGAASTLEYRRQGYLPETMLNFLVRLGWSHGDQEIFSMEELIRLFSLEHIGKSNAVFNTEKLDWISGVHMKSKSPSFLMKYMKEHFKDAIDYLEKIEPQRVEQGIAAVQEKVKRIPELIEQLKYFFGPDPSYDVEALKDNQRAQYAQTLTSVLPVLKESDFSEKDLEQRLKAYVEQNGQGFGKMGKAVRYAVTGGKAGPGLFQMLELQGKEAGVRRIEKAIATLSEESN